MLTPKDYIFGTIVVVLLAFCGVLYFENAGLSSKLDTLKTEKAHNAVSRVRQAFGRGRSSGS